MQEHRLRKNLLSNRNKNVTTVDQINRQGIIIAHIYNYLDENVIKNY